MSEPPPDWIWHGVHSETGATVTSYGRWPLYGWQRRYKLAETQPTEHDHLGTQEPTMSDLVKRLRRADEYEPLGHDGWEAADLIDALVAALDRWEAAYQTGRHEPLVIAREAASAVLARTKGEPK